MFRGILQIWGSYWVFHFSPSALPVNNTDICSRVPAASKEQGRNSYVVMLPELQLNSQTDGL